MLFKTIQSVTGMKKIVAYLNKKPLLIWAVLLLLLYILLDYFLVILYQPAGMHFYRQTDSLSFVLYYLHNGLDFFDAGVLNLGQNEGKALAEFPILYYFSALFSKLFGFHPAYLRIMHLIIITIGFTFLFKMLIEVFDQIVYALITTFLVMSSTALLYYANNFLPDSPALGLCFIGMFHAWKYYTTENKKHIVPMMLLFTFSCLLKVTFCVYPAAFLATLFIQHLISKQSLKSFFSVHKRFLIFFALFVFIVAAWYFYAIYYNQIYHSGMFNTKPWPIWNMSANEIAVVWDLMSNYWDVNYYYPTAKHLLWILSVVGLIPLFKRNQIWVFSILSAMAALTYVAFFFFSFRDHDYYFLVLIPAIAWMAASGIQNLRLLLPRVMKSPFPALILTLIVVLSVIYAQKKIHQRYNSPIDKWSAAAYRVHESEDFIRSKNITQNDKIVVVGDFTPNGSLYFLNQHGWQIADTTDQGSKQIKYAIQSGACCLIIAEDSLNNCSAVKPFIHSPIGGNNKISLYKL